MKVLYISRAIPEDYLNEINRNKNASVFPQQTFDFSFAKSLSTNYEVSAYSLSPLKSFPKSKKIFITSKKILYENMIINIIPTINIKILKQIINSIIIFFITLKFIIINRNKDSIIIVGFPALEMMIPIIATKIYKKQKRILVVPDLPDLLVNYTSNQTKKRISCINRVNYKYIEKMDGYVLLTKYMNEALNKKNRPYIVIEGLIDTSKMISFSNSKHNDQDDNHTILYAGSLNEKFGVKSLVEALDHIQTKNIKIQLYGNGDYTEKIKSLALGDSRIEYGGVVSRSSIIELQCKASLLINPRPIASEFTKYSFPSKTIEYMLSGTPFLTTRLPGIPDEYFNYLYVIDDDSPIGIAKSIDSFFNLDKLERENKGRLAQNYIIENKNLEKTSELIRVFINQFL